MLRKNLNHLALGLVGAFLLGACSIGDSVGGEDVRAPEKNTGNIGATESEVKYAAAVTAIAPKGSEPSSLEKNVDSKSMVQAAVYGNAKMNIAATVISGPGSNYSVIGSVSKYERVQALWSEVDKYYHIEYKVNGTSQYKRGYVTYKQISIDPYAYANIPNQYIFGYYYNSTKAEPVYGGPGNSRYVSIGSISKNENVKLLKGGITGGEDLYNFIEYKVTGTKFLKRGYVPQAILE